MPGNPNVLATTNQPTPDDVAQGIHAIYTTLERGTGDVVSAINTLAYLMGELSPETIALLGKIGSQRTNNS
jgi:hypothetical protein